MLRHLACSLVFLAGCAAIENDDSADDYGEEFSTEDVGDGDGESGTGTGDGDTTADSGDGDTATAGDGDTNTTGDGDGDTTTGDGDGDTTTGDGDGDTGNPGNPYDAAAQHCVDVINMYRATENKPPYQRWTEAEVCSGDEAESDSISGTPHGAFGSCGEWAQNECPGWPGPPEQLLDGCLAAMWAEGPGEPFSEHGHYINMSSLEYTKVACGFFQTGQGDYWAIQNFQ